MKKIHLTTTIDAPREAVCPPDTYRTWTAAFTEGSYYEGSWEKEAKIRFLAPGGDGMVSELAENRTHAFISIKRIKQGLGARG
jgi:hypothetical protein